jgi:hypothetical protein
VNAYEEEVLSPLVIAKPGDRYQSIIDTLVRRSAPLPHEVPPKEVALKNRLSRNVIVLQ